MRKHNFVKALLVTALVLTAGVMFGSSKVSALSGYGFFGTGSNCTYLPPAGYCPNDASFGYNDVLTGRSYPSGDGAALSVSTTQSSSSLKSYIIGHVEYLLDHGSTQDRTGAAFIIDDMANASHDRTPSPTVIQNWEDKINNPAVQAVVVSADPNNYSTSTSFYDPAKNDDFFAKQNSGARYLVVFRNASNPSQTYYVIEVACGNPLGGLPGLPSPSIFSLTGTASTNGNTSVQPGDTVTFNFSVKNSGSAAASGIAISENLTGTVVNTVGKFGTGTTNIGAGSTYTDNYVSGSNNKYTIPKDAQPGDKFCGVITFKPASSTNPGMGTSNTDACYVVGQNPIIKDGCPALPSGTNVKSIPVSYFPYGEPSDSQPSNPTPGKRYATRSVTGHTIVSAKDVNTGTVLPVDSSKNTIDFSSSVLAYPYDSNTASYTYTNDYTLTVYEWQIDSTTGKGSWKQISSAPKVSTVHPNPNPPFYEGAAPTKTLGECYNRNFTVQQPPATDVTLVKLQPSYEDPTKAVINTVISVKFSLDGPALPNPLRTDMSVKGLTYSGTYYIKRANGMISSLGTSTYNSISAASASNNSDPPVTTPYSPPTLTIHTGIDSTGLQAGDRVCATFKITYEKGEVDEGGNIKSGTGSVKSSTSDVTNCSSPVINEPTFKVFNNNVSAGGDFETAASCDGGPVSPLGYGSVTGYFNYSSDFGNHFGSSADLSVLALKQVTGFGSKMFNYSNKPYGRTFANTGSISKSADVPPLGGYYATGAHCLPAFKVTRAADHPVPASGQINLGPGKNDSGVFVASNGGDPSVVRNVSIRNNPGKIRKDTVVYVDGNIYIGEHSGSNSDIELDQTQFGPDTPSVTVIANGGNIYIDSTVKNLDGIYVAQKVGGKGGEIFTCYDNGKPPLGDEQAVEGNPSYDQYSYCKNQLVVHGAFLATKVHLQRTYGSLRDEKSGTPARCSNGDLSVLFENRRSCGAEVFDFSPELYLGHQPVTSIDFSGTTYDAITSLPPVL